MDQLQAILLDMQERRDIVRHWMNFDLNNSVGLTTLILVINTVIIVAFSQYLYFAKNVDLHSLNNSNGKCKCS